MFEALRHRIVFKNTKLPLSFERLLTKTTAGARLARKARRSISEKECST